MRMNILYLSKCTTMKKTSLQIKNSTLYLKNIIRGMYLKYVHYMEKSPQ